MNDIKDLLIYDPVTGHLIWKVDRNWRVRAGNRAGCVNAAGYRAVFIFGSPKLEHRLAWELHYGKPPPGSLDHINGDRTDNRIVNLRVATHAQNMQNKRSWSRTGFKGVKRAKSGRYEASIQREYLGVFDTPEAAHAAYSAEAKRRFGDYAGGLNAQ